MHNKDNDNNITSTSTKYKYPVRRLDDVLYPDLVRIVSVGKEWSDFTSTSTSSDSNSSDSDSSFNYSAEYCGGTHATNTGDLRKMKITRMTVVGDSSFELEAASGREAFEIELNDRVALDILEQMSKLKQKIKP